jgi:hypothetical protein
MRRGIVVAAVCAAILIGAASPGAALRAMAVAPPRKQAFFNDPFSSARAITDRLVQLIGQAARGATIRIAVYLAQDGPVGTTSQLDRLVAALKEARRDGVAVRVVIDSDSQLDPGFTQLRSATTPGEFYVCHGCFGGHDADIMHDKFMLIDDMNWIGSSSPERVVAQMSANWNEGELRSRYNNLVVAWGDEAVYQAYDAYWRELAACTGPARIGECAPPGVDLTPATPDTTGDSGMRVSFFPRAPEEGDHILDALSRVDCSVPDARIEVVMFAWQGTDRGALIAGALRDRQAAGCAVRVVVHPDAFIVRPTDQLAGIPHRLCRRVHSKYLLVDAGFRGDEGTSRQRRLWTGSPNFTSGALLHNDEAQLELWSVVGSLAGWSRQNGAVYTDFTQDFDRIWQAAGAGRCG